MITGIEDKISEKPAMDGGSWKPKRGYQSPLAIGMP